MNDNVTVDEEQVVKKRTTHIIKVGKNVRGIRLEFDEDGNFTEIAIDYGEPDNS